MGYTTDFDGSFVLDAPLTSDQLKYLLMFSNSRRMQRDASILNKMEKNGTGNTGCFILLKNLGMTVGKDGGFYCGEGFSGQDQDSSIVDYNYEPAGQPSLWCQWFPNDSGTQIITEGEKFYNYIEWLQFIIDNFLKPWGHVIDGVVEWSGEEMGDIGVIEVVKNKITTHEGMTKKAVEKISNKKLVSKPIPKPRPIEVTMDEVRAKFGCDVVVKK